MVSSTGTPTNYTRRYFTESCKKFTGLCHNHWRNIRRFFRRILHNQRITPILKRPHVRRVSVCTTTDGVFDGYYRRHSRRITHIPKHTHVRRVSVCTSTNVVSNGYYRRHRWWIMHIPKRTHVRCVSVCTSTDGFSDGSKKSGGIFKLF